MNIKVILTRNFQSQHVVDKWKKKRFTGFNVSWHCSNCDGELNRTYFRKMEYNKLFVQIANLIHEGTSPNRIWALINSTITLWHPLVGEKYTEKIFQTAIFDNLKDIVVPKYIIENIYTCNLTSAYNVSTFVSNLLSCKAKYNKILFWILDPSI